LPPYSMLSRVAFVAPASRTGAPRPQYSSVGYYVSENKPHYQRLAISLIAEYGYTRIRKILFSRYLRKVDPISIIARAS
jgi:hypothetical protein